MDTYDEIQKEMSAFLDEETQEDNLFFSEAGLSKKKKAELVALCKEHSLNSIGKKAELVERLVSFSEDTVVIEAGSTVTFTKGDFSAKGKRI